MIKRKSAFILGWSLIVMAIVAGYSLGFAFEKVADYLKMTTDPIPDAGFKFLFTLVLWGIGITVLLDIVVSVTIYDFFKGDSGTVAFWAMATRLVYTSVFGFAGLYLFQGLFLWETDPGRLQGFFDKFRLLWNAGLILFGVHLVFTGWLMKLHRVIPAILWLTTFAGGGAYFILHLMKTGFPEMTESIRFLELILMLPMVASELGLAVWLVWKGGKPSVSVR